MPVGDEEKMGRPNAETKGGGGGIPMGGMPVIMDKYVPIVIISRIKKKGIDTNI